MTHSSLLRLSPGPIRSRLLRDLILLVVSTVALLATINLMLINGIKQDLAANRIEAAATLVKDEIRNLLLPVRQQLLIIRDGLRGAGLAPTDEPALNQRLVPTLAHMPQIAGVIDALADGQEYFLRRNGEGWLTQRRSAGDAAQISVATWDAGLRQIERHDIVSDHDPRTRGWFTAALETPEKVVWSQPYIFASLGVPGITAALAWPGSEPARVTALDVTLESILDAIKRLGIGDEGQGFLFSREGGVFVPPDPSKTATSDHHSDEFFSAQTRLGGPLQFDAVAAWKAAGEPHDDLVRFHSANQDWWGGFRPLTRDPDGVWIAVVLPVSETLAILQTRWHVIALTVLGILAASLGLALLVVRKYSRQLVDLPKLSLDRRRLEQDLRELITAGEGTHLEFKSTMRMNLRTQTTGKEIELAWLKGVAAFLNTEGGILLIGIADDGSVLGMDADRFDNEDKCQLHFKNLLSQHLGPEYARFVRFYLHDLDGRRIGAVECECADAPAFLRDDKQRELFIIRNGPSNIELSISRALKYIQGHF